MFSARTSARSARHSRLDPKTLKKADACSELAVSTTRGCALKYRLPSLTSVQKTFAGAMRSICGNSPRSTVGLISTAPTPCCSLPHESAGPTPTIPRPVDFL